MSDSDEKTNKKRSIELEEGSDSDGFVGPTLAEAAKPKKRKILQYENLYLESLPSSESYEKSYMHRDIVTHCVVSATDFIITASYDGHIKFWKKMETGIEFVKHFRSHLGPIVKLTCNSEGTLLCSASSDKSLKIFDVVNFDMINMMRLDFVPGTVEWIHGSGEPIHTLAVSDKESPKIYVYDGRGDIKPIKILEKIHMNPIALIRYNHRFDVAISVDKKGMLEYWQGSKHDYDFPKNVAFDSKLDTDLFEFAKNKTIPTGLSFSNDGRKFATISTDRRIRIFNFVTGKLLLVLDESLPRFTEHQQKTQQLPNMEFGRRMAIERDLEKSESFELANVVFDESGYFIMYATLLGIKLINVHTNRCVKIIGKNENLRMLNIALYQGSAKKSKAAVTLEIEASNNPTLDAILPDPTLICTAYKKSRFYLFTRREPDDLQGDQDRDVFNEKPSKEDTLAAAENPVVQRLYDNAILHTVFGDIHIKLFVKDTPKTVENFCVHSKNGYYNGHIFHRVIKGFMIQTGDPTGNGTGGESIWGGEFEDEIRTHLKHDRPYTVSMANAGPNTNGSQFFITLTPTPWLDNKHTVFGRVVKGMEVVQNISNVKTNAKTDKPYDDIRIISVTVK
ncbi:peptidylprolyl isomerase domain and WD repeat-containing protein 1 [Diorhabda sublineata]|uniref:peptidylprolyl isomerase domain and WD repeat-containing protein 1 n=1 Tax=Diorhabda sublineata TaxID=1163346 RepID=UPI0024E09AB3|nr:peptidylprolyl isomerase domain and WD repeat-containing protein 1 [Diorhabda sublineata]